jgi:polyhydroxyalkanoate synthesis regulator phasin
MSAYEVSAREHLVLSSTKDYIEEVLDDSESLADIHNEIFFNKQTIEDNHRYAMEHINDECNNVRADLENDIESLRNDIDDLKQIIEELQK